MLGPDNMPERRAPEWFALGATCRYRLNDKEAQKVADLITQERSMALATAASDDEEEVHAISE